MIGFDENRSNMLQKRALVTQERLFFRNIPLSNWVEQEIPVEDGANLTMLNHRSVFSALGPGNAQANRPGNSFEAVGNVGSPAFSALFATAR